MNMTGVSKNISAVLVANIVSLAISVAIAFILPKFVPIEGYSYFQLYIFYSSYIIYGHLGIVDGIYLRYGGKRYDYLDNKMNSAQFILIIIFECLIAVCICTYAVTFSGGYKMYIFIGVSVSLILANARIYITQLMQTTGDLTSYARVMLSERIVFFLLCVVGVSIFKDNVLEFLILADIIARCVSFGIAYYILHDFFILCRFFRKEVFVELKRNFTVGVKLYISNLSSMLILGIYRFFVEHNWDVIVFGKISLALSAINAFLVLSNAVGISLFPMLRREKNDMLDKIFPDMKVIMSYLCVSLLICYYPIKAILLTWLPMYEDSYNYMGVLFPMCLFDMQWIILINTYMKVNRMEASILHINLFMVAISTFFIILGVQILKSFYLTMSFIVFLLCVRSLLGYWKINTLLKRRDISCVELWFVFLFWTLNYFFIDTEACCMYFLAVCILYFSKYKSLKTKLQRVKRILNEV